MEGRRIVPVAVMAVGVALATAIAIPFATGSVADFADLVPAPDEIVWVEGEQTTLWLSTNRHAVDVEIGNIALGLGDIEERTQGQEEPAILGVGPGCLDLVVASLTVEHDTGSQWSVSGTIERGPNTTGDVEVHVRYYRPADQMPEDGTEVDVTVSAGSDEYSLNLVPGTGIRRVQVSTDEHYPAPFTRQVDFDPSDTSSGGTVTGEEVFHMLEDTGLGLIACGVKEDVLITLHGDDGEELNRYLVDVGPRPTPTAIPTVVPGPSFGAAYVSRRFCADDTYLDTESSAANRAKYLSGDERVGAAVTASGGTGTLSYSLGSNGPTLDYLFFDVASSTGQLTVNSAGADGHSGIDGTRLYPVVLTATDTAGASDSITIAAHLDAGVQATGTDDDSDGTVEANERYGVCP